MLEEDVETTVVVELDEIDEMDELFRYVVDTEPAAGVVWLEWEVDAVARTGG